MSEQPCKHNRTICKLIYKGLSSYRIDECKLCNEQLFCTHFDMSKLTLPYGKSAPRVATEVLPIDEGELDSLV